MFTSAVTAFTAACKAIEGISAAAQAFVRIYQDSLMQELGQLRQENELLKKELANTQQRLNAVMAAPSGGRL